MFRFKIYFILYNKDHYALSTAFEAGVYMQQSVSVFMIINVSLGFSENCLNSDENNFLHFN